MGVVAVTPADGATEVLPGVVPTVRFSEPVAFDSLAGSLRLEEADGATIPTTLEVSGDLVRLVQDR